MRTRESASAAKAWRTPSQMESRARIIAVCASSRPRTGDRRSPHGIPGEVLRALADVVRRVLPHDIVTAGRANP